MNKTATVGITGATGFIGRALVQELVGAGFSRLRLFGRRASEPVFGISTEPLDAWIKRPSNVDCLVHLAGDRAGTSTDARFQESNVRLTEDLARAAGTAGVRRFVFVSSMAVYGKWATDPITPETPLSPSNAYGCSKADAEARLVERLRGHSVERIVVRPPMVYGASSRSSLEALTKMVRLGTPLPLGSATAPRSFCSIANLTSALIAAIQVESPPPPVFLPADPEDFNGRDLAGLIKSVAGSRAAVFPFPATLLQAALGSIGRSEMAASLLKPMRIDRTHWDAWNWMPVETGESGITRAVEQAL